MRQLQYAHREAIGASTAPMVHRADCPHVKAVVAGENAKEARRRTSIFVCARVGTGRVPEPAAMAMVGPTEIAVVNQ